MESTLDNCYGIILDKLNYQNEGELTIELTELIVSNSKVDLNIGNDKLIKDLNPVQSTNQSKRFKVEFEQVVFHQVVDESYCTLDNYEIRDGMNKLRVLSKSRYLDFINENYPFYDVLEKKGTHYRLVTSTEVIDIIAYDIPIIKEIKN